MFVCFSCVVVHAVAQDSASNKNWHFLVEPYMMFPNMKGNAGIGNFPNVPVDANVNDIFSHLQSGLMLNTEIGKGRWTVTNDFIYMYLKQDATPGTVIKSGKVTAKQFAWEFAALYQLHPMLDVGIAGLLNSIEEKVDINVPAVGGGTTNKAQAITKTWVDPMIIVRLKNKPDQKFIYQLRGEMGGFGVSSQFAWQVQAYAGYRFSKLFQATAGYRVISFNYNTGSGESRYLYDMDTFGPVIRLGFNF